MTPGSIINMVKRFTRQYGVKITWVELKTEENSRGVLVTTESEIPMSATVLILKEKYSVLKAIQVAVGISQDYTRYVLTLPDVAIKKDMVITDNHGMTWKLGVVDWFDVGGVPVAKQASLLEVV